MDKLETLKIFVRVAETCSFTRTADELSLPRATISAAVQQLEAHLGTRLLHRTTRHVQPTLDGTALLDRCRQVLDDIEEIDHMFRQSPAHLRGRLRIDVPSRIARCLIAPALPEFFQHHPAITLEMGSTDRRVDLIQEGIDCAIRVGELEDSSLVARSLGAFELINCASPVYIATYGTPKTPADLAQHFAVNYASANSGKVFPWEYRNNGDLEQIEMASKITVNNAETYIACAESGLGLIQVPSYDVTPQLISGALVEVLPDYRADAMPVFALYPHRRHLSPRVKTFLDWVEGLLEGLSVR